MHPSSETNIMVEVSKLTDATKLTAQYRQANLKERKRPTAKTEKHDA